jgi:hypothetical protein
MCLSFRANKIVNYEDDFNAQFFLLMVIICQNLRSIAGVAVASQRQRL